MIGKHVFGRYGLGALVLAAVLPLIACGDDAFPDYNYKMTIYAGNTAFSSVRRIDQERVQSMIDSAGVRVERKLSGEAVILDLNGRTYYALLSRPNNADYALLTVTAASLGAHIPNAELQSDLEQAVDEYKEDKRRAVNPAYHLEDIAARSRAMTEIVGPKDLPRTLPSSFMDKGRRVPTQIQTWPMFVTFDDPSDPMTVREVSPDSIGVSQITVEITDEDVTTGIDKTFSWWDQYKKRRFDGSSRITQNMTTSDVRNSITTGDFSTGEVE